MAHWIDLVFMGLYITIGIAALTTIGFFIYIQLKYKYRVRLYRPTTNGGAQPIDKKAKLLKAKDGNLWWKIQGREFKLPVTIPPDQSLMILPNGKICAEGRICSDGNIEWLRPVDTRRTFYKDPLTTADRQIISMEYAKAAERNKKSWWGEHGASLVTLGSLTLIIISILIFGGDFNQKIMEPSVAMTKNIATWQESQTKMVQIMQDMKNEVQTLRTDNKAIKTQQELMFEQLRHQEDLLKEGAKT